MALDAGRVPSRPLGNRPCEHPGKPRGLDDEAFAPLTTRRSHGADRNGAGRCGAVNA